MPSREEVVLEAERRGVLPPKEQAVLSEARKRGLVEGIPETDEPGLLERGLDVFTGQLRGRGDLPEFGGLDIPSEQLSQRGKAGLAVGFLATPDEQARVNMIRERIPGAEFSQDEKGNTVISLPPSEEFPEGQQAFLNSPGISLQDVTDLAAGVIKFLPAAKIAGAATSLAGRFGLGFLASGGTSVAEDIAGNMLGGDRGIDLLRAGLTAITGGSAELAGPLIQKFILAAKRAKTPLIIDGVLTEAGETAAASAGLNPGELSRAMAESVADVTGARIRGAPGDVAGATALDFPLTRGQAEQDFGQIAKEEALRARGDTGGQIIREFDELQSQRAREIFDEVETEFAEAGGRPILKSAAEGGGQLAEEIQRQSDELLVLIDDAYETARGADASISREGLDTIGDVRGSLAKEGFEVDETLYPATARSLKKLEDLRGEEVTRKTMSELEQTRKVLRRNQRAANNREDAAAAGLVLKRYDEFLDDAFDNALFDGDEAALTLIKEARDLRAEYGRRFQERTSRTRSGKIIPDPGGKTVESIVERTPTDEAVVNMIFGRSRVFNDQDAIKSIRAIRAATGDAPVVESTLKQLAFRRIMVPAFKADRFSAQAFVTSFDETMRKSPTLMRELFTRAEITRMREFRNVAKLTIPPPKATNVSGTAGAVERRLQDAFVSLMGAIGLAKGGLRGGAIGRQVAGTGVQAVGSVRAGRRARAATGGAIILPGRPDDAVISSIISLTRGDPERLRESAVTR